MLLMHLKLPVALIANFPILFSVSFNAFTIYFITTNVIIHIRALCVTQKVIFRLHRFQNAIEPIHTHIQYTRWATLYLSLPSLFSHWQLNCGPSFEMESNWFGWANKSGNWQLNLDPILSGSLGAWSTRCASMGVHTGWLCGRGIVDFGFKDMCMYEQIYRVNCYFPTGFEVRQISRPIKLI